MTEKLSEDISDEIQNEVEEQLNDKLERFNSLIAILDRKLDLLSAPSLKEFILKLNDVSSYQIENMQRLQVLINEFKGLVAMVRGEKSQMAQQDLLQEIFMSCIPFIHNQVKEKFKDMEKKIKNGSKESI